MSIVEKAISKMMQKQATGAPARSAPAIPAGLPAKVTHTAEPAAGIRHVPPYAAGLWPATAPTRRIHIELDELRRQGMLAPEDLARQLTDQYRRIKWPLLDAAFGRGIARVDRGDLIMVTSSMPDEGKTFTSLNLALSIARERDCTVLLVDADVAKATISNRLGLSGEPGLVDLLASEQTDLSQVLLATNIDGLEILPAGRRNLQAPELFASRRMEEILAGHSQRHPDRIVLFDSSPLLATNEAQVLARLVGQVLMVVCAGRTPQPAVLEALALLDRSRAISCVLNLARGGFGSEYYGSYGDDAQNDVPAHNKNAQR